MPTTQTEVQYGLIIYVDNIKLYVDSEEYYVDGSPVIREISYP